MDKIKTYNIFINESLKDKLKGKSENEISGSINNFNYNKYLGKSVEYDLIDIFKKVYDKVALFSSTLNNDVLLRSCLINNSVKIAKFLLQQFDPTFNIDLLERINVVSDVRKYDVIELLFNNINIQKIYKSDRKKIDYLIEHAIEQDNESYIKLIFKYFDIKPTINQIIKAKKYMANKVLKVLLKRKNPFTNESLKDKLKGKSDDEIKNNLLKLNPIERIKKINNNNFLNINNYPSKKEIQDYIDNFKHFSPFTLLEKSIIGRYPEGIKRALNSNKLFNKDKYLKKNKLSKDDILISLHMCVDNNYTEGFKLLVDKIKIPKWHKYKLIRKAAFNKNEEIIKILSKMNLNRDDLLHEFNTAGYYMEDYTDKEIDDAFELIEKYL